MEIATEARRIIVLDTETTGLDAKARIVELAAVEVEPRSGRLGRRVHYLLDPQVPIPAVVTRIHGIRDGDIAGKPRFGAIADELCEFLRGATLAIQNAAFDRRMLEAELSRAGRPSLDSLETHTVDTVAISRGLFPLAGNHRLDDLCDRFGIDRAIRRHHGALVDVRLLAATFPHLAAAYDTWREDRDAKQGPGLLQVQRESNELCDALEAETSNQHPEKMDRTFARVAAADLWFGRRLRDLTERLSLLTPPQGWATKHVAARWRVVKSVAWKLAALDHLALRDLEAYQYEARALYLTPLAHEDAALDLHLVRLAGLSDAALALATQAQMAQYYLTLRELCARTGQLRSLLRAALLGETATGYGLCYARLEERVATHTRYREAMAALAPGAELEPFTNAYERLSLRSRDLTACATLFGEHPAEARANSSKRVA